MESLRGSGVDRAVLTVIGVSLVLGSSKTSAGDINADSDAARGGDGACGGDSDGDGARDGNATRRMMMMMQGGRGDGGSHVPTDGDYTLSPAGDDSVGDGVMMMAGTAKVRRSKLMVKIIISAPCVMITLIVAWPVCRQCILDLLHLRAGVNGCNCNGRRAQIETIM